MQLNMQSAGLILAQSENHSSTQMLLLDLKLTIRG